MFRRRRPLMRAAIVGGAAYHVGKRVQQGREEDDYMEARVEDLEAQQAAAAQTAPQGMTDAKIAQIKELAQLRDAGVLTEAEFEVQKQKLLQS
jgi:hypothetical protein